MTVGLTEDRTRPAPGARPRPPRAPGRPARAVRPAARLRAGQIVALQLAAALLLAAAGRGPVVVAVAIAAGLVIVAAALVRVRRRWLFEWIGVAARYATRRHVGTGTGPAAVLELVSAGARISPADLGGEAASIVDDGRGFTAVLDIGDRADLVADEADLLPGLATLLPPCGPDQPGVRVQLLLTGAPAPAVRAGNATPATSYRQLTDGHLLGHQRALVAVRVLRGEGWRDDELRRALSGVVRKVRRRLEPLPVRVLGEEPLLRVLGEAAHHNGGRPGREGWQAVELGDLSQASFRLSRWPDLSVDTGRRLVPRLLTLPAAATTVSLTAGPWVGSDGEAIAVDLTVRLAAPRSVATAAEELRRLLAAEAAAATRLDGDHLAGMAATLPLATGPTTAALQAGTTAAVVPASTLNALELPLGPAGLMVGANRHGTPVTVRLFRADPTRIVLVGGVRVAQLLTLRAMALGARIVVQTGRPQAWEPFVRGASAPGDTLMVVPPGRPVGGATATPLQPVLVVVDVGPVAADPQPGPAWQASVVVRDDFTATDLDAVGRADLVLLQTLRPDEAALAATALGLGASAEWLTRIPHDMVAVVNRRSLRWALLSTTPIESQLVGEPARL